jgi:hypothetical protein
MSNAVQVENVVSKVKDYDVTWTPTDGEPQVLEYTQWMLPGKSEASSYNLITNLRNIEESAGDGTFNTLTISVPISIAKYKEWLDFYDKAGTLKIASIVDPELAITFNVRVNTIGDFTGSLDSINSVDVGFKVLSLAE